MAIYTGINGKRYAVEEPPLGKGGEGSVYKITGMPNVVLKVFIYPKRTETRHRKLLAMIATPLSSSAMDQVTWPIDVVYQNNQFVGYVMPAVKDNEELNVMYSDKYRCTLSEKIVIAMNLCAAINAVHNAGQVCGDLNPKNIVVDPKSARITLVDTDSYHITENNNTRVYRCEVGLPEYLPREIQEKIRSGQTLSTVTLPTFTKQTDLFALAVHIFALLMNGCHPFACARGSNINIGHLSLSQNSVVTPQPIDNICTGFFPFSMKKNGLTTPKYAPDYSYLPDYIRNLFEKAFIKGHSDPFQRPNTVEWYQALSNMRNELLVCKKVKDHMYVKGSKTCPWCELDMRMKVALKPTQSHAHQIAQTTLAKSIQVPKTNTAYAQSAQSTKKGSLKTKKLMSIWAIITGLVIFLTPFIMLLMDKFLGISLEDNLLFRGISFLFYSSMMEFTYEFQMGFFKFSAFLASVLIVVLHVRKNMRDGDDIGSAVVGFLPYIFTLIGTYVICLVVGWLTFHHTDSAAMIYSFAAYMYLLIYTLIDNKRIKNGTI